MPIDAQIARIWTITGDAVVSQQVDQNGGDARLDHPSMVNTLSETVLRCPHRSASLDRRLGACAQTASALWSVRPIDQFCSLLLPGHRLVCRKRIRR
jgi:hypothetical protein